MKANIIANYGPWQEVMTFKEVDIPLIGPHEVLLEVHGVAVNYTRDTLIAMGKSSNPRMLPLVTGQDPAGLIVDVGKKVEKFKIGENVVIHGRMPCKQCRHCKSKREADCPSTTSIGIHRWGGYAQYCAAPEEAAYRIPDNLSFAEAAVIMRHGPTALQLLKDKGDLKAGEWVLIMGAAGGLGGLGIQLAKFLGATVIAAAGADDRVKIGMKLGADFGINYRKQDLHREVINITKGRGVDLVYENISDPNIWPKALASLTHTGRLVTAGAHGGPNVYLNVRSLYHNRWQIKGAAGSSIENVKTAIQYAKANRISCSIDKVMPLADLHKAYTEIGSGQVGGKIIIDPSLDT